MVDQINRYNVSSHFAPDTCTQKGNQNKNKKLDEKLGIITNYMKLNHSREQVKEAKSISPSDPKTTKTSRII
uniref:Uncharacterized protein n=1 Tax=Arundo donax TaxID=35708 RepID=A0A0A9DPT9_ARUDO